MNVPGTYRLGDLVLLSDETTFVIKVCEMGCAMTSGFYWCGDWWVWSGRRHRYEANVYRDVMRVVR